MEYRSSSLTTNIDTINVEGHAVNTVSGNIGANQTYNTGDTVNGNGLTKVALVADGANLAASNNPLVDLNDVAAVNVNLVSNTAVNEGEFTNVAAVNITNGVAASVLTLNNATADTVYGSTTGRFFQMAVNYASAGAAAELSATNANIDFVLTNESTVNLATVGNNTVVVDDNNIGSDLESVTVTGDGALDLTIIDPVASFELDASATTGDNTLRFGQNLSSGDTILGGQGTDTLVAELNAGTTAATITDVEDVELAFTAAGSYFSAVKTSGITEIDITAATDETANLVNLQSTVASIDLLQADVTSLDTNIGFVSGTNAALVLNVGADGFDQVLGNIAVTNNAGDLTINSVLGDTGNVINNVTDSRTTSLTVNATEQSLEAGLFTTVKAAGYTLAADNGFTLNIAGVGDGLALNGQSVDTLSVTASADSTVVVDVNGVTADSTIDTVSIVSDADATVSTVFTETGAGITVEITTVDASASAGATAINLSDLTVGTDVTTGDGDADVLLTQDADTFTAGSGAVVVTTSGGADSITLGSGDDQVILTTDEDVTINDFTVGTGNDLVTIDNGAGWQTVLDAAGVASVGAADIQTIVAGDDATYATANMIVYTGVIANDAALLDAIDGTDGQLSTALQTGDNVLIAYYDGFSTQLRSVDLTVSLAGDVTAGVIDGGATLVGIDTTDLVNGNFTFA